MSGESSDGGSPGAISWHLTRRRSGRHRRRAMSRPQYLLLVFGLWISVSVPLAAAFFLADTLDWYPWLVLFGAGVLVGAILFKPMWRAHQRLREVSKGFMRSGSLGPLVWLAPPLWTMALGMFANAYLDPSPPTEHASEVVRVTTGKNRAFYLREFRPGGGEFRLSGGNSLVQGLTQGQAVTLVARAGLFGWGRLVAITPR